ncbi:MAG: NrfD/PsrC family molybdoenzyme membrane anchor subunit [Candidatus Methanomethylicia archaeon]
MSYSGNELSKVLRPLTYTSRKFYIFISVLAVTIAWFLYAWYIQLYYGLGVTGMRDYVIYGLYIANFVFLIGVSHAGIAISAGVRLLRVVVLKPIVRMAELLTAVSLIIAFMNVLFDLGRPERVLNMFAYGRWLSVLVWDMTSITTYLVATIIYLYVTMREDIALCAKHLIKRSWLYKIASLRYKYDVLSRKAHEKAAWWLALVILPIMVSVHTVVSWVFGLMVRPGWYNPFFGPYFVTGAIASGVATIIMVAAVFRKIFQWEFLITPQIFRILSNFLRVVLAIYIYFMICEQVTIRYLGPAREKEVSNILFFGDYAALYWFVVIITLAIPFIMLSIYTFIPKFFSIKLIVLAATLINIGLWIKRIIIVIPVLLRPELPYPLGIYIPTWVEFSLIIGGYAIAALIYTVFIKLFPIVELAIIGSHETLENSELQLKVNKNPLVALAIIGVLTLISGVLGMSYVKYPYSYPEVPWAPAAWLLGIITLLSIPLAYVLSFKE